MSGINSASVVAGPLFRSTENGLAIMSGSLYIHELTYDIAQQWIGVLNTIKKEDN